MTCDRETKDGRVSPSNSEGSQTCLVVDSPCSSLRAKRKEETTSLSHPPSQTTVDIPPHSAEQEAEEVESKKTELEKYESEQKGLEQTEPERNEPELKEPEQKELEQTESKQESQPKEPREGPYGSQVSVGHGANPGDQGSSLPSADD